MDWKTFVADLVKSLAWPCAAIAMVWLLRVPLGRLIRLLRKLKYKEFEAEFSQDLNKLEKVASKSTLPVDETTPQDRLLGELNVADGIIRHVDLLEASPEAAILTAWVELQQEIYQAAVRLTISRPKSASAFAIREKFWQDGWLTPEQYRLIIALHRLRNKAAHGGPDHVITVADATRFLALIEPLIRYFRSLTPESPKPSRGKGNP
jgi:hypothetical protein